jgi:lysozyme
MTAAEIMAGLCLRFEGVRLRPYICPAGVPTIGVGATHYVDGRMVTMKDSPISRDQAMRLLQKQITGTYLPGALALCPTADTEGRKAALGDFAFNLGLTRLKGSTLRRRVLAGDWDGARVELAKWTRGGGKVLPGLVARRKAEIDLTK